MRPSRSVGLLSAASDSSMAAAYSCLRSGSRYLQFITIASPGWWARCKKSLLYGSTASHRESLLFVVSADLLDYSVGRLSFACKQDRISADFAGNLYFARSPSGKSTCIETCLAVQWRKKEQRGKVMTDLRKRILPTVQKPARYTGGEFNEIKKNLDDVRVRVAFCFPDTYEIGMSNLGMRILYGVMNEMDGVWCERVFAPWGDMEEAMRHNKLPLWALESQDPVKEFDMIAFTVGYEMSYSNILRIVNTRVCVRPH